MHVTRNCLLGLRSSELDERIDDRSYFERIVGGGHTWPSGSQYLPRFTIGRVSGDIDGAETAWAFFREFR